jgi:hypothetical protein
VNPSWSPPPWVDWSCKGASETKDPFRDRPWLRRSTLLAYMQSIPVGPGPTLPLVLLANVFPTLVTVAVELHGTPIPYCPLYDRVEVDVEGAGVRHHRYRARARRAAARAAV